MIVTVLNVRRFVRRSMITVLEQSYGDSDGDYVRVHSGITKIL
jgi:hydrogenase maturation factor